MVLTLGRFAQSLGKSCRAVNHSLTCVHDFVGNSVLWVPEPWKTERQLPSFLLMLELQEIPWTSRVLRCQNTVLSTNQGSAVLWVSVVLNRRYLNGQGCIWCSEPFIKRHELRFCFNKQNGRQSRNCNSTSCRATQFVYYVTALSHIYDLS